METSSYVSQKVSLATQSGPLMVKQGTIHPKFQFESKNAVIRNAVVIVNESQVVFAISDRPINFYDFSIVFRDKPLCKNALYLDGFTSKMYLPEIDGIKKAEILLRCLLFTLGILSNQKIEPKCGIEQD